MDESTIVSEDFKKAALLDCKIKASAQQAQQSLYEMCMGFKQMRDEKLYKALGYDNFGDYCEQGVGFKYNTVYNYIAIVEKLSPDFVNSGLQIGIKKLRLLATLSDPERTEITENTDLESVTVKELKAKIKELEGKNAAAISKATELDVQATQLRTENENLRNRPATIVEKPASVEADPRYIDLCGKLNEAERANAELREQIQNMTEIPPVFPPDYSLDECFDAPADSGQQYASLYESLHAAAVNAMRNCADFLAVDVIPNDVRGNMKTKFKSLKDVIEMMEEDF